MKKIVLISLLFLSANCFATGYPDPSWSYNGKTGPEKWATIKPAYALCGNGKHQSPINITNSQTAKKPTLRFNYQMAPLRLINDGITLRQLFVENKPAESISIDGKKYRLVNIHFHLPSEHTLNKQRYPMEVHLVHEDNKGKLAVIAVLLKKGHFNRFLATEIVNLPPEKDKINSAFEIKINPLWALPSKKDFYIYQGSLTTPPCTEDVTWIVMQQPIEASAQQIAFIEKRVINDNSRPVQELDGRPITLVGKKS